MRKAELDILLTRLLQAHPRISDLNFAVGRPFQIAADGLLHPVDMELATGELTGFQTEQLALALIDNNRRLLTDLFTHGSCDFSYFIPDGPRFRVNIFSQKGYISIVMRKLESEIPTIQGLDLPECFHDMAKEKNGIILFVGATGTGKTTSLAAILDEINENEPLHIISLEDPIEYVHHHKKATFNQRELGKDFDTFANGLRAAMRQAPHVILVGEIRDRETMEIALNAAETGHLVFSTLHTVNAGHTINRIIGLFSAEEEQQVRFRLADTLRWVVAQRLLPKVGGGRQAAFEILQNNLRVKDSILHGEREGKTFYEIMDAGSAYKMQTFDQHIIELFRAGIISEETAVAYATSQAKVRQGVDQIKSAKGEKTSDIEGLSLEQDYR
ncbi:PilT/PilU family type 4a pilus ATPase [Dissulfurirhabdus thermomarina]|uniref:PilT/PilU family type 4a pilus ATPase n=1 Tax=Dissulfurirhabdus thermomarina TaxID=1765737 RepID=A0A6N9TL26_DISTH|nr:PilT/PilU family type 4a pilus ATPase [Dissulfurirhabdus thermomarina]NDY41768.1 PilT/PilU family type 4a pilus ATPase [Dissulfurirhabdus thermomarina]NMX24021.1 PilT/PilU family type 4a pilus ATPase [Dissulfurirhabdus thermomarina]